MTFQALRLGFPKHPHFLKFHDDGDSWRIIEFSGGISQLNNLQKNRVERPKFDILAPQKVVHDGRDTSDLLGGGRPSSCSPPVLHPRLRGTAAAAEAEEEAPGGEGSRVP